MNTNQQTWPSYWADLSPDARAVLKTLSDGEKQTIQKGNPFRSDREALIRDLRSKGVKINVLCELSGFSRSTMFRITNGLKYDRDHQNLLQLKKILRRYKALVTRFKAISNML